MHLVNQFLRDGFAGEVVFGEGVKELFLVDEVLVELRGQFDKVARDVGTALCRVLAAGEHSVESVSELV